MTDTKNIQNQGHTKKPQIGDTRPATETGQADRTGDSELQNSRTKGSSSRNNQSRDNQVRDKKRKKNRNQNQNQNQSQGQSQGSSGPLKRRGRKSKPRTQPGDHKGRYQMLVHKDASYTHTAIMQGKMLVEYSVSRDDYSADDIYGNIYKGVVKDIYAGTEMAFVNIGTEKNAALHKTDMMTMLEETDEGAKVPSPIDVALRPKQQILCQITKNPIGHKGARLTLELNLPGRYVVMVPESKPTITCAKSLSDSQKKRLQRIVEKVRPENSGFIIRTVAMHAEDEDIVQDMNLLIKLWGEIQENAKKASAPSLIYRGADNTFRKIRDRFNEEFRSIVVDDKERYNQIYSYLENLAPALVDRVQFYDAEKEPVGLFAKYSVNPQLQKSLDKRVWLPSGGEIVIEGTEAMTVVDVNTARNTGSGNLENTALQTNIEAASEISRQLRLRDIGGIIVIDFIDLESKESRNEMMKRLKEALSEDPTRTYVENVSSLGTVQMTRKRIGEQLLDSFSKECDDCEGNGYILNQDFVGAAGENGR